MSNRIPEANTPNRESSPNRRLYTAATPIRFAPHGLDDNVVILDPRNVQQWQLDACEARLDETASQMAKYKERVQELEFLAGNSADTEAEDQAALRDELEMLREELGKMIISQQQKAQAEEESWLLWKAFFFWVVIPAICFWASSGFQSCPFRRW